jgi:hypothetical protein
MIFCNHYSNCRLLLTPVILTLYLTLSISSSCTLVLTDYDFRCSTSLYMLTVSISYIQRLCTIVFPWQMGKYKYKRLPMGIKIAGILMFFKASCLSLSKIWNMLRQTYYLDDFLILTKTASKTIYLS